MVAQDLQLPVADKRNYIPAPAPIDRMTSSLASSKNDVDLALTILFNGYKSFLSSQDMNSCNFQPSCSVYGLHAIRSKGLIMGTMSTFDRLTRCHGLTRDQYEIDPKTGLQIDDPAKSIP